MIDPAPQDARSNRVAPLRRPRLSAQDWLAAAMRALVAGGPGALKVEPLARSLGTTKGSFYWHFADPQALRDALIALWFRLGEAEITASVTARGARGIAALEALLDRIAQPPHDTWGGPGAEAAIRAWAFADPVVAAAVTEMDGRRLAVLRQFFAEAGQGDEQAAASARLFYAAVIGQEALALTCPGDLRAVLQAQLQMLLRA